MERTVEHTVLIKWIRSSSILVLIASIWFIVIGVDLYSLGTIALWNLIVYPIHYLAWSKMYTINKHL